MPLTLKLLLTLCKVSSGLDVGDGVDGKNGGVFHWESSKGRGLELRMPETDRKSHGPCEKGDLVPPLTLQLANFHQLPTAGISQYRQASARRGSSSSQHPVRKGYLLVLVNVAAMVSLWPWRVRFPLRQLLPHLFAAACTTS